MLKKILLGLVPGILLIGAIFYGCGKAVQEGIITPIVTSNKISVINVSVSGNNLSFGLMTLDQNNNVINGIGTANLSGAVYAQNPLAAGIRATDALTPVANLIFNSISGGPSGTHKNLAIALAIDKSDSMYQDATGATSESKVVTAEAAATAFVGVEAADTSSNKAAIINFAESVSIDQPMIDLSATNLSTVYDAIKIRTPFVYGTALYDAIGTGIDAASNEAANLVRAVVVLTDGGNSPTASIYYHSTTEVIAAANASNIPVYTVGVFWSTAEADTPSFSGGTWSGDLKAIAKGTTGSENNYFQIVAGLTGLTAHSAIIRAAALNNTVNIYQSIAQGLIQSYTVQASLSNTLSPGIYYALIQIQNYGQVVVPIRI